MENSAYYIVNNDSDIDFQYILNDYIEIFTRKKLIVTTTYKKLETFEIRFDKFNLPHLLGLHKVLEKRATKILQDIVEGKLDIEHLKSHTSYGDIKDRILSYNFLHRCFILNVVKLCIIIDSNDRNPQNLDVVFIDDMNKKSILIGLRKARGQNFYVPTTMYVIKNHSEYLLKRRTNITNMTWLDYN
ncbi:hypothetical protein RSA37_11945 [Mammaliicoccus sciuri]|uniref:PBECR4 domain-containing protein n=1 Tax=Mammaliicoccus sciuri TaxID=1296 RepID=UPI000733D8FB|nr:PBECR4 domain-containing protein [Mammaliicoccus sciuri]KTT82736.1 hypothetical protein NS1R_12205 [Mammaliicoccus sciuri]KTT88207.1 hypothetical protein NS112_09285 [Mammaliicoccus sciuri]KTT89750.1 hypothetical protein NS36R_07810 [Mammaliicoccus sciuri]KTT94142.1 hypothetical protein NS44R_08225 [Mammaliicoccus sciuri]KTW10752.1 hypothetical protein RSA37_11945 [Mammaliicoccus sciuri]